MRNSFKVINEQYTKRTILQIYVKVNLKMEVNCARPVHDSGPQHKRTQFLIIAG